MLPPPPSSIRGIAARVSRKAEVRFSVSIASHTPSEVSSSFAPPTQPPIRCATASSRPPHCTAWVMAEAAPSSFERSSRQVEIRPGCADFSSSSAFFASVWCSATETRQPASRKARVTARPRLPAPPEMKATGPPPASAPFLAMEPPRDGGEVAQPRGVRGRQLALAEAPEPVVVDGSRRVHPPLAPQAEHVLQGDDGEVGVRLQHHADHLPSHPVRL